jgi:ribosomal protein S18 acetylase RimI-like enzyme
MRIDVPAPYTARHLTVADARGVYEVMAADQQDQIGRVDIEPEDIVGDWQRPSFDVAASTIGAFLDGDLVAYAEYSGQGRGDAAVHPAHRGRGLGTAMARFMQETARANGADVVGMPVPQGGVADRFLEAQGYRVRWQSWVLQLPEGAQIQDRALPEGYAVREATPEEYPAAHDVVEDAFLEWSVRDREPLEDFLAGTVRRPGFAPWMLRVVTDADGRVAAVACIVLTERQEAYIDRLATRADQRHRGLAQALMVDAFRAGRENGATTSGLSTDSRTGALGLYQKVGMVVVDGWVNRAIDL